MSLATDPWHLWGSSVLHTGKLQAVSPSPFDRQGQTRQIARVSYARPDTWSFFFGLILHGAPDDPNPGAVNLRADFELVLGIGRSRISLQNAIGDGRGFCRLTLSYATPLTQIRPFGTWTSVAQSPPLDTSVPALQTLMESFPAQDIQCSARIFGTGSAALLGQEFRAEVHAYFAPRTHMRPDWFREQAQFRGNETGGT